MSALPLSPIEIAFLSGHGVIQTLNNTSNPPSQRNYKISLVVVTTIRFPAQQNILLRSWPQLPIAHHVVPQQILLAKPCARRHGRRREAKDPVHH